MVQLGLHVQVGTDVNAVKHDVAAFKDGMHLYQVSQSLPVNIVSVQTNLYYDL